LEVGAILLDLALILGVACIVVSVVHLYSRVQAYRRLARYLVLASFLTLTIAFFLMVYYFAVSDLHIEYVHHYTHKDHEWLYKLAGVWGGEKGTLLLWTWLVSLSLTIEEALQYRKMKKAKDDEKGIRLYDWIRTISMILLVSFLALLVYANVFQVTSSADIAYFPDGRGLNPLLLTPLMAVHPPLEFLAYAFIIIPAASAFAYLVKGDKKWVDVSIQWSRWSWLFLTIAMGIGALWAYAVLGWGGYWGWDPVEVANLIPWIALTAFVHSQSYYRKRKQYVFVAPLLAVVSFVLILFATFETRSGFVTSPLHAFTGPGSGLADPVERLMTILTENPTAAYFMMLMVASLLVAGILFLWRFAEIRKREGMMRGPMGWFLYIYIVLLSVLLVWAIVSVSSFVSFGLTIASAIGLGNAGIGLAILTVLILGIPIVWIILTSPEKEEGGKGITLKSVVNDKNTMIIAVAIFSIWFVSTFLLMILGAEGLQPEVLESRLPLILIPLLITLVVCLTWRYFGRTASVIIAIALIVAAIVGYAIPGNRVFGAYVGVLVVGLVASFYRLVKIASGTRKIRIDRLRVGGMFLIAAGTIGVLFWSNMTRISTFSLSLKPTPELAILGALASIVALIGGLLCVRGVAPKLSIFGAICGILSLGFFFVGTALGIISLILILTSLSSFSKSQRKSKPLRTVLGATGPYLVHVGAMLLIVGYVASTTLVVERDFAPYSEPLIVGSSVDFEGYQFELVDSEGEDLNGDGTYEDVRAFVDISRDGSHVGQAVMRLSWMIPASATAVPHYMLDVYVENTDFEDLYFIGYAFNSNTSQGWPDFIYAQDDQGWMFTSDQVNAVGFQVKKLPLMNALWGGMWIMAVGIFLLVVVGYFQLIRKVEEREEPKIEKREGPKEFEKDYERRLEEELKKLEDGG
jgi:cytochrome c-type biogenesis protein CcmF